MILVTGANGNVGREIVAQLVAAGHSVRALLRSQAKTDALPNNIETVVGDFSDGASLARAVNGAEAIYMTSFDRPELLGLQKNLISAARDAGVRVLVRLSGMRADAHASGAISQNHGLCDQQVINSGLGYVILQPNWFYQNFLDFFPAGEMKLPVGDGLTSFIDVRDIAAVAIAALTDTRHVGETYVLTGPEALSHAEIAHILSEETGGCFAFEDVTEEAWNAQAIEGGMEERVASGLIGLFRLIREGRMAEITNDVERVTGRPPIRFSAFARDYAEALCRQL